MKVISTNIAESRSIKWRGEEVTTGIFKYAVKEGIFLGESDVNNDSVIDRRYHGGVDKACYLYSANHYNYWQNLYPDLEMPWGMFGENLTVEGLHEAEINIGNIYKIGEAVVQATQPRQPCFKLEFRIPDKEIVRKFVQSGYSGVYVRVLEKGQVKAGDTMKLIEQQDSLSIQKVYELLYTREFNPLVEKAVNAPFIAESCKRDLLKRWGEWL
uniref:MOSC domain-containing protein n=1 Tax=uncultured Draconibacterium sp. TaxID=1573823 RepID=UPI00321746B6